MTLHDKMSTVRKLTEIIGNLDDKIKQDIILHQVANKLNIPFETLKGEGQINDMKKVEVSKQVEEKVNVINSSKLEKRLFALIMNNFSLLKQEYYNLTEFFSSPMKEILTTLINFKKNNPEVDFNTVSDSLTKEESEFLNRTLLEENEDNSESTANFKSLVTQFQKKNWKSITQLIKIKLAQAQRNSDTQAVNEIISSFQKLKEKLVNGGQ
jgi:hypothetical protein